MDHRLNIMKKEDQLRARIPEQAKETQQFGKKKKGPKR